MLPTDAQKQIHNINDEKKKKKKCTFFASLRCLAFFFPGDECSLGTQKIASLSFRSEEIKSHP